MLNRLNWGQGQRNTYNELKKYENNSWVLSYLAYECKRDWSWPCFDTELSALLIKMQTG